MQRLHAAVHHLREARVLADLGDGDSSLLQGAVGAASGEQLHAIIGELAGEVLQAVLIGDGDECAVDRACHRGSGPTRAAGRSGVQMRQGEGPS